LLLRLHRWLLARGGAAAIHAAPGTVQRLPGLLRDLPPHAGADARGAGDADPAQRPGLGAQLPPREARDRAVDPRVSQDLPSARARPRRTAGPSRPPNADQFFDARAMTPYLVLHALLARCQRRRSAR